MIDLHSHLLPETDDGAKDLATALQMAELAVSDGVSVMACTPHVKPPVYDYTSVDVAQRVAALQSELDARNIPLKLVTGGDIHVTPDLLKKLQSGEVPTLNNSRYFLLEMDHELLLPQFVPFCEQLIASGFVPILTHPERTRWIATHYDSVRSARRRGMLVQVTAASILGGFGGYAEAWSDRLLGDGLIDVVASDAHNMRRRPPGLSSARAYLLDKFGEEATNRIIGENPARILSNQDVKISRETSAPQTKRGTIDRWLGKLRQNR